MENDVSMNEITFKLDTELINDIALSRLGDSVSGNEISFVQANQIQETDLSGIEEKLDKIISLMSYNVQGRPVSYLNPINRPNKQQSDKDSTTKRKSTFRSITNTSSRS